MELYGQILLIIFITGVLMSLECYGLLVSTVKEKLFFLIHENYDVLLSQDRALLSLEF
jgi:hypothetical protein